MGKCLVTPWQKGLHWGSEPCSIDHWVCRRCKALHTSRWNYKVVANQQVQGWLYWGTTDCVQTSLWPVQLLQEVYTHPIADLSTLRYLIHTKFRYSSTVTSSYSINKRQNMAWRKLIINNRQKSWDKNYAEDTAGTRTFGHFRIARAVSQGSKLHSGH